MIRIALQTALATPLFVVALQGTASAEPDVSGDDVLNQYDVGLTVQEPPEIATSPTVASSDPASSDYDYALVPICQHNDGITQLNAFGCQGELACGDDGTLQTLETYQSGELVSAVSICVEPGDPVAAATAPVLTPGRILEAFRRIPLPEAPLEVQPPGGETLVNFDTILHTQAEPFTETVQLLGRQVTFDISPASFTWSLGNGETMTTTDPGRPWARGVPMDQYVSHRYTEAGPVTLDLTTTWGARWRLGNGPWRDVDGTVTMTSPAQDLQVRTAQPQLVSYD
ncbi:hypothetical protein [Nocardioides salarius]|uniref:hypothetical protein n=1 Tax=Nocardioides salarius TaxID=374513 RepID=UPI0030F7BA9E